LGLGEGGVRGPGQLRHLTVDLDTLHGPARAELRLVEGARLALVLGHGAGGGIQAPDLQAAARAAAGLGVSVALVEQPYRVAGRRSQPRAQTLDEAWLAIVDQLEADPLNGASLITGGRSAGARVACRTAAQAGAEAVLCLAFPLHPPGKGDDPSKSRLPELEAVTVPVLIVQGERDPFGMPPATPAREVVKVPGNHSLRNAAAVEAAVADWLRGFSGARS
jgi:uncharacterized protein